MSLIGMSGQQRDEYFAAGQPNPVWGNNPNGEGLVQIGVYYGTPGTFRDDSPNYHPFNPAPAIPSGGPSDPASPGLGFSAW